MTWQKVEKAEVEKDSTSDDFMKIKVSNESGFCQYLSKADIADIQEHAKKMNWRGFGRPVQTWGQKVMFCQALIGHHHDFKNLNGPAKKGLIETAKEAREMAKEKHVEWKFEGLNKEITPATVNKYLETVQEFIIKGYKPTDPKDKAIAIDGFGSSFKTFKQAQRGDGEDKYAELTVMATIDKDFATSPKLLKMVNTVIDLMANKYPDLKFDKWEVKE